MQLISLAVLVSAATVIATSASEKAGLVIDVTRDVECTRKTKKGDTVHVHYRGTLQSDGSEFDASYKRGEPLSFQVGKGMVIKGWVNINTLYVSGAYSPPLNNPHLIWAYTN